MTSILPAETVRRAPPFPPLSLLAGGLASLLLALLAGCASTPPPASQAVLEIRASSAERIVLNDDEYEIDRLPDALRRLGVPRQQAILIRMAHPQDRPLMVRISAALRGAGYSRFMFAGEQHAESSVASPAAPPQQPPAATRPPPARKRR